MYEKTKEKIANYLSKICLTQTTRQGNGAMITEKADCAGITEEILKLIVYSELMPAAQEKLLGSSELRNQLKKCPLCGSSIEDRKVAIFKELIVVLHKIYCWCGKNRRHEFEMKEVREFMGKNEYARFGDLVRFGGLLYKVKTEDKKRQKAHYGLNMERAREFFAGERQIPLEITLNQINNEIIDSKYVFINQIPELKTYLDQNGQYDYHQDSQAPLL